MFTLTRLEPRFINPVTCENFAQYADTVVQNKHTGRYAKVQDRHLLLLNSKREVVDVIDFLAMYKNETAETTPWFSYFGINEEGGNKDAVPYWPLSIRDTVQAQ